MSSELVIDGDGHCLEHPDLWHDYLDPEWRDSATFVMGENPSEERLVLEDMIEYTCSPQSPFTAGDAMTPRGIVPGKAGGRRWIEGHPGGFFGEERLKVHDAEGIDAAVIFTTLGLFCGSIRSAPLADAVCRAMNRWLAEYCSVAPNELYGVATLPVQDPALAAAELRRCVEEHRFVAGTMRPNPTMDGRTVSDPAYEVLWATAEDLDVPICLHEGVTGRQAAVGTDRGASFLLEHAIRHPFEQMIAFGQLLEAAVFDRHDRLRVGFMECSSGWVPFWLDRLDEHIEHMGFMLGPRCPKRSPSEIFRDQCVVGCEGEEPMLPYVQERVGENKVLWASDFPHFDCEVPGLVSPMLKRDDLSPSQRDGVLRRAAVEFYHLDPAAILGSKRERLGAQAVS